MIGGQSKPYSGYFRKVRFKKIKTGKGLQRSIDCGFQTISVPNTVQTTWSFDDPAMDGDNIFNRHPNHSAILL